MKLLTTDQREKNNIPALPAEEEAEIRKNVRESFRKMPLREMIAGALKAVKKHGLSGFLSNPETVIEDAVINTQEIVKQNEINLSIEQSKKSLENE